MLNIDSSELLFVALVALVVIGPKDLPKAMRVVGYWVGRARGVARQFRQGFDSMVREAELEEMEKKWAEENARIMREHPAPAPDVSAQADQPDAGPVDADPAHLDRGAAAPPHNDHHAGQQSSATDHEEPLPMMVEKPVVLPAPERHPSPHPDSAPS